jgi:hypothetical protein
MLVHILIAKIIYPLSTAYPRSIKGKMMRSKLIAILEILTIVHGMSLSRFLNDDHIDNGAKMSKMALGIYKRTV